MLSKGVVLSPDLIRGDRHPLAGATNTNEKPRTRIRDGRLIEEKPGESTGPGRAKPVAHRGIVIATFQETGQAARIRPRHSREGFIRGPVLGKLGGDQRSGMFSRRMIRGSMSFNRSCGAEVAIAPSRRITACSPTS